MVLAWSVPFSARPASAGAPDEVFSLAPFVGLQSGFRFGRLIPLPQTADVPEVRVTLERQWPTWGISLSWELNRRIELRVDALSGRTRIMNDVGIGLAGVPLGKIKASDAVFYSFGGSLLCHVLAGRFSPFLAIGGGAAVLDTEKIGSKTRLFALLGAGIRLRIGERLRGTLEFQDAVTFFRFDRDFEFFYIEIYRPDFKGTQHTAGLFFGLGYVF
jgi:hypothetical protein